MSITASEITSGGNRKPAKTEVLERVVVEPVSCNQGSTNAIITHKYDRFLPFLPITFPRADESEHGGSVDRGRAGTEGSVTGNPGAGHSGRPSAPRRRLLSRVIVAATAALLCTLGLSAVAVQAAKAADAPTVTSVSPGRGIDRGGTLVTITGTGFTNATEVDFDSADPDFSFTVVSDTEITATTTSHADGMVDVTVVTPDGTSAVTPADQFTFVPGTEITGISPASGPTAGGNTITITGTGFTGTTAVLFEQFVNGSRIQAASFTVDSDTQVTATVPPPPAMSLATQ